MNEREELELLRKRFSGKRSRRRPTADDEVAASQHWFINIRGRSRHRLRMTEGSKEVQTFSQQTHDTYSPLEATGLNTQAPDELAYASKPATYEVPTRPIPFSSERELWLGVRSNI